MVEQIKSNEARKKELDKLSYDDKKEEIESLIIKCKGRLEQLNRYNEITPEKEEQAQFILDECQQGRFVNYIHINHRILYLEELDKILNNLPLQELELDKCYKETSVIRTRIIDGLKCVACILAALIVIGAIGAILYFCGPAIAAVAISIALAAVTYALTYAAMTVAIFCMKALIAACTTMLIPNLLSTLSTLFVNLISLLCSGPQAFAALTMGPHSPTAAALGTDGLKYSITPITGTITFLAGCAGFNKYFGKEEKQDPGVAHIKDFSTFKG